MINWTIVNSVVIGIVLADLYKAIAAVIFAWLNKRKKDKE